MSSPKLARRSFLKAAGAASAVSVFAITGRARAAAQLRLAHPADTSHPVHLTTERMIERIAERTGGEVAITLFPNNMLGAPTEVAQQTRAGAIDLTILNPANIEALSSSIGVVNIPYQFDGYDHAHKTLDDTGRAWLSRQLADAGFTWVSNYEWGFRALSNSRRPVETPEDIEGLKIRVPPELAIKAAFEALGANTQTIAFQEVYLALANKTVDGQDNPIGTTFAGKFYEVQDHIALTKHIYATTMLMANPRKWEALSDDQRAVISEEAMMAGTETRQAVQADEEDQLAQMEKAGLQITRPDVAPFRERMEPAYAQLRQAIDEDVWEAWAGFVDAARA
ncbi:TRAP transporter substrate-binding protein [Pikeienuella sp. HZG-20]|uniref:TRAP transporter substrate-binding protein n=1 Tax=Paludibacillus litoralis TaxID=3133267 RepID=UPI0030EBE01D